MTSDLLPETLTDARSAARRDLRRDLHAAAGAVLLFARASLVGTAIEHRGGTLFVNWPPFLTGWGPRTGPSTSAAIAVVAVAVVAYGPALAARLPWRALLLTVWVAGMAWTWSLALIDGWQPASPARWRHGTSTCRSSTTSGTSPRRCETSPSTSWVGASPEHSARAHRRASPGGHPHLRLPGPDRTARRRVGRNQVHHGRGDRPRHSRHHPKLARRAVPRAGAGRGVDGHLRRRLLRGGRLGDSVPRARGDGPPTALDRPSLRPPFGLTVYLSHSLTLFIVIAAAVLLLDSDCTRPLPFALAGFAVVPVMFTACGFYWWEAYDLLVTSCNQDAGGTRKQAYWVWASLACQVLVVGLASAAGLRRTGTVLLHRERTTAHRLCMLVLGALVAMLVADLVRAEQGGNGADLAAVRAAAAARLRIPDGGAPGSRRMRCSHWSSDTWC